MSLPQGLLDRALRARLALEIGAGSDFSTALALAREGARVVVTDVDERVLLAPLSLHARLLDVTRPDEVPDADLVFASRLPEELQLATARLANRLGADLAVRALKDEWADVSSERKRFETWSGGWRFFPYR